MPKIKFSHNYSKLWNQETAVLVAIKEIIIDKDTNKDLIEYDTKTSNGEYFPLKNGKYIQLFFVGNKGIPFCTIRSAYPPTKISYYKKMIGKNFDIKTEENKKNG